MRCRHSGVFGSLVWGQTCDVRKHTPAPAFGSARGVTFAGATVACERWSGAW